MKRDEGAWTASRVARKIAKHVAFVGISLFIAHVILSYFVSLPAVFRMVRHAPDEHAEAFAWVVGITAVLYGNFAFFREQFCVVMCPYGRLQSVLLDDDSLVVGYDKARGEPRGHRRTTHGEDAAGAQALGDCVACDRCVAVCPTGIDIRDGLQMDCIACTACIDACDDVMARVGKPRGLIRYDSPHGLAHEPRRFLRARIVLYSVLLAAGLVAVTIALRARTDFEANVVRLPGAPFTIEGDVVRNGFEVHLVNKVSHRAGYDIRVEAPKAATTVLSVSHVDLDPLAQGHVVFFVVAPRDLPLGDDMVHVTVSRSDAPTDVMQSQTRLLGVK